MKGSHYQLKSTLVDSRVIGYSLPLRVLDRLIGSVCVMHLGRSDRMTDYSCVEEGVFEGRWCLNLLLGRLGSEDWEDGGVNGFWVNSRPFSARCHVSDNDDVYNT